MKSVLKALITVCGGVATAFADPGVSVVVLDFDNAKYTDPKELVPIHGSFTPLMELANVAGDWPVSEGTEDVLLNEAIHPEHTDGEVVLPADFVRHVANLKKWGEPDDDGRPFRPSDGLEDSHAVLMRVIDMARVACGGVA